MDGRQLRTAREQLGFTQAELGRRLDCHRSTVARWEAGTEPVPRAVELAVKALAIGAIARAALDVRRVGRR